LGSRLEISKRILFRITGLYNRRGFLTFAEQHLKLARRIKRELLLVFLDLDGLKQINDTFGHPEGGRALVKTAQSLKASFHRDLDIIARLGGDEFVVLTMDSFLESAEIIYTRLEGHLKKTSAQTNRSYQLSFCLGLARFNPKNRMTLSDMMAEADEDLYKNKRARDNPQEDCYYGVASKPNGRPLFKSEGMVWKSWDRRRRLVGNSRRRCHHERRK
jgi:diguanylate cyclase (GGDEF)-like protein